MNGRRTSRAGKMRRVCHVVVMIMLCLSVSMLGATAQTTTDRETSRHAAANSTAMNAVSLHPSPEYAPREVIRFQVEALAHNDNPHKDAGIEIAFRFASPVNKTVTGPLDRFIRMVHSPRYRPMLHHQAAQYGTLKVQGDQAMQSVILTASNGKRVGYIFILSKQQGDPCEACWMTDSVLPFDVEEA